MQTDPIGYDENTNLYAYCFNNPINYTDSHGEAVNLVAGGIGAGVGGVVGAVGYTFFHEGDWSWSQFIGSTAGGAATGGVAGLTLGTSLIAQAGFAGGIAVGAGSSLAGYATEVGTSQIITKLGGQENWGIAKEWSTSEALGATALGGLTGGIQAKFNFTSHVRGRWPTTLKTSLVGKHAQALYKDAAVSATAALSYQSGSRIGGLGLSNSLLDSWYDSGNIK